MTTPVGEDLRRQLDGASNDERVEILFDVFRDHLNWQDIGVVESVQRGMRSRGYRPGRLMVDAARSWRSEASVHHFDSLVWRALNGSDGG